uniref:Uncharacterized protein n=1 Tax=Arundo donax TaxID=35708 RepID=A0A0A9EA55_ARUDO
MLNRHLISNVQSVVCTYTGIAYLGMKVYSLLRVPTGAVVRAGSGDGALLNFIAFVTGVAEWQLLIVMAGGRYIVKGTEESGCKIFHQADCVQRYWAFRRIWLIIFDIILTIIRLESSNDCCGVCTVDIERWARRDHFAFFRWFTFGEF